MRIGFEYRQFRSAASEHTRERQFQVRNKRFLTYFSNIIFRLAVREPAVTRYR